MQARSLTSAMSQGTPGIRPETTLFLPALNGTPSTPTGPKVTPSTFIKKFNLASISAKSKRLLSFRGSASKERNGLPTMSATTTPSRMSTSDATGEQKVSTSTKTPVTLTPITPREAQSEVVRKRREVSCDPPEATYTPRPDSPVQNICDPESPTVNVAQRRARSGTMTGELGRAVKLFSIDDARLSYANSMDALSNDFAEHVFPESPLLPNDIPKSEINIPYPSLPVSLGQAQSFGTYTFRDEAAPYKSPAHIKVGKPVQEAVPEVSPVVEIPEAYTVENRSSWLHIAKTVQRAAKHLSDDEDFSPVVLFQTLGPIVLVLYGIGAGILITRYQNELSATLGLESAMKPIAMFFIVVCGAITTLITLKLAILISSSLMRTFCEMDLEATFYKGECVDAEGKVVGESDLLLGSFLFASPSSPTVA